MSHVYLRSDCTDGTERRSQTSGFFLHVAARALRPALVSGVPSRPCQPPSRIPGLRATPNVGNGVNILVCAPGRLKPSWPCRARIAFKPAPQGDAA